MLYLHQYPAVWDLPSLSPFCIKVETYLRMVNLPYKIKVEINPSKGPKGKMPVLRDDEIVIADSTFIIEYLQNKYHLFHDANLSVKHKALAHAVQKMIEENLYFVLLYSRWIDPAGKEVVDQEFRKFFPGPFGSFVLKWIRNNLKKQAYAQGMSRHSINEVYQIGQQDICTVSNLMGSNHLFFLGDQPHTIDATIYAFLKTILHTPFVNPLKRCIMKHDNLMHYCETMKNRFFA